DHVRSPPHARTTKDRLGFPARPVPTCAAASSGLREFVVITPREVYAVRPRSQAGCVVQALTSSGPLFKVNSSGDAPRCVVRTGVPYDCRVSRSREMRWQEQLNDREGRELIDRLRPTNDPQSDAEPSGKERTADGGRTAPLLVRAGPRAGL